MPSKTVHCSICGEAIRGNDFGERMRKLREHRKAEHPKAHKKSVKKTVKTKRARGIIDKHDPNKRGRPRKKKRDRSGTIQIRRTLVERPTVVNYRDMNMKGFMRVLRREDGSEYAEFALYPSKTQAKHIINSLIEAKFTEEARGKWVLRTNVLSIFVYV